MPNFIKAQIDADLCPNGHPYTPETTYHHPKGYRMCRICIRASQKRWQQAHPDRVKAWREKNADKYEGYQKKWRDKTAQTRIAKVKAWRDRNPEKIAEYNRRKREQYHAKKATNG